MKSNFLKLVLPAFAILLAVGLAFATEDSIVDRPAYYFQPGQGWQSTTVEDACDADGDDPCTYGPMNLQLYSAKDFGSIQLHKD